MDEQIQDTTVNESVQTENVTDSSPVEQAQSQPETQPEERNAEGEQPTQEEPRNEQEQKPRNNAQSRIKELLSAKKEAESERDRMAQLMQQTPNMELPEELSPEEYRALQFNSNQVAQEVQGLKRELAYKDLSSEMDSVVATVPELNPESESYNPVLEELIAQNFDEGYIIKDSTGRFVGTKKSFKEFAQKQVNAFREAETRGATHSQKVLQKQASEAAVTDQSTSTSESKPFESLSIHDMEKQLGFHRE